MTQPLPRTYWCHRDYGEPGPALPEPLSETTPYPGRAIVWMRDAVREALSELDRPTFAVAWAWLGDHQGAEAAVQELRQGKPYTFSISTAAGRWSWSVYPVSLLPVIEPCANSTSLHRELTPTGLLVAPRDVVTLPLAHCS